MSETSHSQLPIGEFATWNYTTRLWVVEGKYMVMGASDSQFDLYSLDEMYTFVDETQDNERVYHRSVTGEINNLSKFKSEIKELLPPRRDHNHKVTDESIISRLRSASSA